jgi:hypothetical protein
VNKERYAAITTATLGVQGVQGLMVSRSSRQRHKELVCKMVKLYFEEEPGKPVMIGVLVNMGWDDYFEDKQGRPQDRICGCYYHEVEYNSMLKLGGYVNLEECYVCAVNDFDECHAAYGRNMKNERDSGARSGDQLEPWTWEVRDICIEKAGTLLLWKLIEGQTTHAKYKSGTRRVGADGYLHDEDYG